MITHIGTDTTTARQYLMRGEIVAIPTETVYGLAGNALNEDAVLAIYQAKNRPEFNPLIVHVADWTALENYATNIPAKAKQLAQHFTPGPLTFLLNKKNNIPDLVTAGSDKVAIRIPAHPLTLALLKSLPFPLAAPSANTSGYISPTTAQHVYEGLKGKISYILDGGAATVGLESTIIGFNENEDVQLYRTGGISAEQIETVLGEKVIRATLASQKNPQTAGQLKSHYAPHTPLYIGDISELLQQFNQKKVAVISFIQEYRKAKWCYVLSRNGSLDEAAKNLFATLRETDRLDADVILAEHFPDKGIGRAINDRLQRAQAVNKI